MSACVSTTAYGVWSRTVSGPVQCLSGPVQCLVGLGLGVHLAATRYSAEKVRKTAVPVRPAGRHGVSLCQPYDLPAGTAPACVILTAYTLKCSVPGPNRSNGSSLDGCQPAL